MPRCELLHQVGEVNETVRSRRRPECGTPFSSRRRAALAARRDRDVSRKFIRRLHELTARAALACVDCRRRCGRDCGRRRCWQVRLLGIEELLLVMR